MLFDITVTVQTADTTTDDYNNEVPDWTDPTEHDEPSCLFAPGATAEARDGGQSARSEGILYTPAGAVIGSTDRVVIRGEAWEVAGEPKFWGMGYEIPMVKLSEGEEVGS